MVMGSGNTSKLAGPWSPWVSFTDGAFSSPRKRKKNRKEKRLTHALIQWK